MVNVGDCLRERLHEAFQALQLTGQAQEIATAVVMAVIALALSVAANLLAKRLLRPTILRWIAKSETALDDMLVSERVLLRLSHLAPALAIFAAASWFPVWEASIRRIALAYVGILGLFIVESLLDTARRVFELSQTEEERRTRPVAGYVQAAKVFVFVVGGIIVVSTLFGKSPWALVSGIGAMTAVLLLIFRDSILGLVASVQIQSHKIVSKGDWIEMPQYGADGDVEDISLHTVKVRNWDKTITTIPTYALVSSSFKNWQAMRAAGGRRIKRCVYIDMNSVSTCTDEMIERFRGFAFLSDYIDARLRDVEDFNREHGFDMSVPVNGRRLTNLGTFRAYLVQYLRRHPDLHDPETMTLLVRHRDLTERGLPVEIYAFTKTVDWIDYERIQADIFDHILAVLPQFDLRVFQNPSGLQIQESVTALGQRRQRESYGEN